MRITLIERAYELADSGKYGTIAAVERALNREKYEAVNQHLGSPSLRKVLNIRIRANLRRAQMKDA